MGVDTYEEGVMLTKIRSSQHDSMQWVVGKKTSPVVGIFVLFLALVALVVYWEYSGVNVYLYSRPGLIFNKAVELVANGTLLESAYLSAQKVFAGLLLGALAGFPFGVFLSLWRSLERINNYVLGFLFSYPKLALVFLLVIWIGHTSEVVYIFNFWISFLIHTIIALQGAMLLRSSGPHTRNRDLSDAAVLYLPTRWKLFWHYLLPLSVHSLFTALLLTSGLLWPLLIFSEPSASVQKGLGALVYTSGYFEFRFEVFFVGALAIAFCNFLTWFLITKIQSYLRNRHTS